MSGIAAIFDLGGRPVEPARLDRSLRAIAHRGPDGIGRWSDGAIALGHAALHSTPESIREHQPYRDDAAGLCLTLDGRVDNREDIRRDLHGAGKTLHSDSDAEIFLRSYEAWGEDCVRRIIGTFAFALWDSRRMELFCARDVYGVKPFYFSLSGQTFVCGSELAQVVETAGIAIAPNDGFIGEYLGSREINREDTLYAGVFRLTPAHWMRVSARGIEKRRYYDLDPRVELRYRTDAEYQEHYRGVLGTAVGAAMRCQTGIAAELSGGMDSGSVVCMAQSLIRDGRASVSDFETFSLVFPGREYDEQPLVEDIQRMWGLRANYIEPSPDWSDAIREHAHERKDFIGYPNGLVYDVIRKSAAAKGYRVRLTGFGGDQWFTGTPFYYADLIRGLRLRELAADLKANLSYGDLCASRMRNLLRYGIRPLLPNGFQRAVARARGRPEIPEWINPDFARRIDLIGRLRRNAELPQGMTFAQRTVYEVFSAGWVTHGFELDDRDCAGFGIEPRHPLCDRRMLELASSLPDDQRSRGRQTKFIMRESMRDLMPAGILDRTDKGHFGEFFVRCLDAMGGPRLFDSLASESLGWVDGDRVRLICTDLLPQRNPAAIWDLWKILNIELWLAEVGIGKPGAASSEPAIGPMALP